LAAPIETAACLEKGPDPPEIASATTANFARLFRLEKELAEGRAGTHIA